MRISYGKGLRIYNLSPPPLQRILGLLTSVIPRSFMLGSGFHFFFNELSRTQWLKPERLRRLQESRLRALIRHAYDNVPYYHRIFKERNLKPEDVQTIQDLRKIPIISKDDVRSNFHDLVATNANEYNYGTVTTSGSTGDPLTFNMDQQNREIQYASLWRQRTWANVDFNDRIASLRAFRGNLRWYNLQKGGPLWKFNALSKELELNVFAMKKNNLNMYTDQLRKFSPDLIEGYPSAIALLAEHISEHSKGYVCPAAVQTSSETLSSDQRSIIEEALGCKVYDWYGQSEYIVAAGQCPENSYHIVESGIMEFINDGEQVSDGETGEVIGTGLYNYCMPFIRYRITDLGKYSTEMCSCGRGLPIVRSLEGRVFDSILTNDGRLLTGASVEYYWHNQISPFTPNVEHAHIIQKATNRVLVEMVKRETYSDIETQVIVRGLKSLLGDDTEIELRDLDSLPLGRKWRFTESELDIGLI